jgi:hypothetical protein
MSSIPNISLYIPHIFANYTKDDVAEVFDHQNIGKVKNIDFVSKLGKDGKPYNAAYIHFKNWFDNVPAHNLQKRVLNPETEARIMYEDPWYWILLENKAQKFTPGDRKPRIDLGYSNVICTPDNTPEKPKCPAAPAKKSYAKVVEPASTGLDFEPYWADRAQELDEELEDEANMDEIEALIEEEDKYLVQIDSRYVQSVEQENAELRATIAYFQNALCVEQIKTQALAEAIGKAK